jgi:hypothetical protein
MYSSLAATSITPETYNIVRRHYFINRLEKTISLLDKIYAHADGAASALMYIDPLPQFKNPIVNTAAIAITEEKNIQPLFAVWQQFCAYKYIDDVVFVEDFSKEVFIITRRTLSSMAPAHRHTSDCCFPGESDIGLLSTEQILNYLQELAEAIEDEHAIAIRSSDDVSTDAIALRFYHIERLAPHTAALEALASVSMAKQWHALIQYKYLADDLLVRDYCLELLRSLKAVQDHQAEIDVLELSHLSLEELLEALDSLSETLEELLEDHKKHANTLGAHRTRPDQLSR